MGWPTPENYDEAVQNLHHSMGDEELRTGQAALDDQQLPMVWAGSFASVYHVNCPATGKSWALKCFTRDVSVRQERYRHIAAHLQAAGLPFTVPFVYLDHGIHVRGQWFPAVKMEWVEGQTLNRFVEESLDKPKMLRQLRNLWPKLASRLREAGIAHADIQHGNVLLVPSPDGKLALKLIDYDGMYVPSLASTPSGELGHSNYQHPERLRQRAYNADVDRFSHLAIYTAVHCLKFGGQNLWRQFNNDDNLLFRVSDFQQPGASNIFSTLWDLRDAAVRAMVGRLILACGQPLDQTPLLDEIIVNGKVLPLGWEEESVVNGILLPKPFGASVTPAYSGSETKKHDITIAESLMPRGEDDIPLQWIMPAADERSSAPPVYLEKPLGAAVKSAKSPPLPLEQRESSETMTEYRLATAKGPAPAAPLLPVRGREIAVDLGNGVNLALVLILAGEFLMGSPDSDSNAFGDEKPQHRVQITKPFYLGKHLVTQEQWQAVMGSNPSYFKGPRNPVERVSWEACQQFLGKLNGRPGKPAVKFQLPTEAQWEYACRAAMRTKYCFGNEESQLGDYAWYDANSGGATYPVGEKRPNAWGLHDMYGNVWEWCADWFSDRYYAGSPADDPTGPAAGISRVCRGGSWGCTTRFCRSAFRGRNAPGNRSGDLGFRVARMAE